MDALDISAPESEQTEAVKVGVIITTNPESTDAVIISDDGREINYKTEKNEETKTFTFDQVVTSDNIEKLDSEMLQPLVESILSGYNGALLVCGAPTDTIHRLMDHSIVGQVLTNLFSSIKTQVKSECFLSVSFVQFQPDGNALDLLNLNKQPFRFTTHPVLGSFVEGVCEMCVDSAEEACTLYKTCRETMKNNATSISSRSSFVFSVASEWKLNPEQLESDVCRSRLQVFGLIGGASRTDLRGVNPLAKILNQIPNTVEMSSLLPLLLNDVLTGNSKTWLIYSINPQNLLDDETPAALEVAKKAKTLATKATIGRWNPKSAEQEIRETILELQNVIMSHGESKVQNIYKLAELTQNLQMVKNQSWEKRKEESNRIKEKRKSSKSLVSNQVFSGGHPTDFRESSETMKYLQDQLRQEMEEHIREGKGSSEKVQERVARIQQLKEALRAETQKCGAVSEKSQLFHQSQLEYNEAEERRRQLKEDHGRLIQEEVAKMERNLAEEQLPTERVQKELLMLTRERHILVMRIEALRAEAQQAETDLQEQHHRHQTELHCLREESLQVFRVFRQVSEEQRKLSEGRYRTVLLEAVQDAIYLSAQNQLLQADNKKLSKALAEIKDSLAVRGDPLPDPTSQNQ